MGKKTIIGLLSFLSAITLGLGFSACGKNDNQGAQAVVEGFEIKESISVNVGTVIELEQPIVTDSKGVLLDCWTYVTDANGNYVATTAGSFTAENAGVYTIVYVVRDSANNTFEKKTIVNVMGEAQTGEVTLDVDFEQFIVMGETTKINAVCSNENAELVYSVKKVSTGAEIAVNGNEFTPEEAGVYQVTVSVAGGDVDPYTYNVFAEAAAKDGEVEIFGEAWAEKETFIGGKRQDWEIVSTAECDLVDPYGRAGTFAKYSTDRAYIPLFINIRQDNDYYKQLAEEGYTHVSMWIYMDSQKPHISISDRDPNGGFYRREGPNLYPGQWTEFRLNLVDTKSSWTRSFTTCYNMYDNQSHFYLQVDNSYEYNLPWGGGDNITFYFTDIYAIKDVEIGKAEEIQTEKTVGDTVDLSTVFSADFDLDYTVSCRGERTAVDGAQYTFKANGEYTVTAVPKAWDLRGSQSVTFTVTDGFALTSSPVIKERTAESVSVPVSELNAVFTTVDGVTPTIESYKAYFNGKELPVENGAFTAAQDGAYTVEIKGVYGEYASYHTVPVDVYSQATKYSVIDVNHLRTIRAWDWDSSATTAEYGEYEIDGKTGNYVKATAKGQSLVLYAKPMFSKAYYEALAAQYADTKLFIDVYFVPAAEGKTTNFRSIYNPNKREWFDKYNNTWQTYEMTLADFIAVYDDVSGRYEQYKSASFGAGTEGYEGSWLQLIGSQVGRSVYMDVSLGVEATEASVSLKEGASVKVDTDNKLTDLFDITISGESGKLASAEVYFNNAWVEIEKGIFNPAWEVEYQVRFNIETADGFKYKQVEKTVTVGDGSFTATVDTDFHSVEIGNTFDVTNLLTEDYAYSVKLLRSINGEQTVVAEYNDGVIQTNGLASGSYQVNVYATKGNGAYASILYYTLTLDV